MAMETGFLQYTMALLEKEYKKELDMLGVTLPDVSKIPVVRFDKAKELVAEKYNRRIRNPYDLEPEEELLIGRYFKKKNTAVISYLLPIIHLRNVHFMLWMTRQIRNLH